MRTETPIAAAVLPLKSEAIERAEQEARNAAEDVGRLLEDVGSDLDKAVPPPNGNMKRAEYKAAESRQHFFQRLTTSRNAYRGMRDSWLVDIDPAKVERFVQESRQEAATEYDVFIAKLEEKIGEVASATLVGNHVWQHSILTVTKADGSVESWRTQMIVNVSCLGKLFNQFPTRKVKK